MTDKHEIVTTVAKPLHMPIIEDNINYIVATVKQEIADLNIDQMVVSEENKQTLKDARANLNKKLADFETERKRIKEFILQPYSEFEKQYDSKLKVVIETAVKDLDNKIKSIEAGQKKELEDYAKEYFDRKLEAIPLKFANKFENVGIKISLTITKKKIREEIDFHFERIQSAMLIIDGHEHAARLRALFETSANYDIGIALTTLTKQLAAEKKYVAETDFGSIYPSNQIKVVTKVQPIEEKKSQEVIGEVFDFKLSITVTEEQLALLTAFMRDQDITFELYED